MPFEPSLKLQLTLFEDQIGASNFDVFRWPSIENGTEKQNLGIFIVSLLFPGIPLINWGEEQAFYILENTNANYGEASKNTTESHCADTCL